MAKKKTTRSEEGDNNPHSEEQYGNGHANSLNFDPKTDEGQQNRSWASMARRGENSKRGHIPFS